MSKAAAKQEFSTWLKSLKRGKACRCGEADPSCLDWHHRDPKQKEFNVSQMRKGCSKEQVLREVAKCTIVCSNCHRKLHAVGENS